MRFVGVGSHRAVHRPARRLNGVVAKVGERSEVVLRWEARREAVHQGHGCGEIETTRGTSSDVVVVHGEVTIAVGIGTRGSDV